MKQAMVLLSGGLDSTAALLWAPKRYDVVAATWIDYGQPNRDAEGIAADRVARHVGVELLRICVADALIYGSGLHARNVSGVASDGRSVATVPMRNLTFLSLAGARASVLWPGESFDIVIGANDDDFAAFPDCRPPFLLSAGVAMTHTLGARVTVVAPWLKHTKYSMLASDWTDAEREVLARSHSCYLGTDCGECDACKLRKAAFARVGWTDQQSRARLSGGDPHRDAQFRKEEAR